MSNFNIINDLAEAVKQTGKPTTSAYDTPATVTRIDGDTAWVHIPGGVDETPIKKTINAKAGDTVQVRVGGGSAWLVGNQTSPPTDDTKAIEAKEKAEKAGKTATDFVADMNNGIFVHPKDNDSDGVQIRDTVQIIRDKKSVAEFGETARVGANDGGHTEIDANGMRIYGGDGSEQIAHLGYGTCVDVNGQSVQSTYFDFGTRAAGNIGKQSSARGGNNIASAAYASAEGTYCSATGYASKAGGQESEASERCSSAYGVSCVARSNGAFACGMYNLDNSNDVFSVGNGDGTARSNAFSVRKNGNLMGNGIKLFATDSKNDTITVARGATTEKTISVSKSGYTPWALRGFSSSSASCNMYKCYLSGNNVVVRFYNPNSTDIDITLTVYVAYIATSAL